MHNILVIIKKQIRDTFKNKTVLIQFILFPLMTMVMENAVKIESMPEFFFIKLFAVMYIGMAPFVTTASMIAEEKERNTLRVLMMADVMFGRLVLLLSSLLKKDHRLLIFIR